jgi:hypothetical protein
MSKLAPLALAVLVCTGAGPALAQVDPWEFEVYAPQTVGHGMLEVESLNGFVADGHGADDGGTASGDAASDRMYRTSLELAYGLTDKIEAAAYVNFARPDDRSFAYAGSKFRLRGSLFEQGELPVDLGWYVELEWNRTPRFDDQDLELELRPIVAKDLGRFSLVLNPKFEKVLVGSEHDEGFEFGYAAGLYYRAERWLSPGIEVFGGIGLIGNPDHSREQQHYLFAVLHGELPGGIEYSLGPGIGLTPGSDSVVTKLNIEIERFVGRLF